MGWAARPTVGHWAAPATLARPGPRARVQAEATAAAERTRARADRDARATLAKAQEEAALAWQEHLNQDLAKTRTELQVLGLHGGRDAGI